MFDQRDRIREINTEGLPLEETAKTHLLADLAFWMIRNGESEVEKGTAREIIRRSLTGLAQADLELEKVFRFLLERSGLLRQPTVDRVDFIHRTFQEFLAAKAAIYEDAIGELLRNAEEVQWREVVLLAAGQANHPQATRLLQGLLGRTSPDLSSGLMAGAEGRLALFVAAILASGYDNGPAAGPGGRGSTGPGGSPSWIAGTILAGQGACGSASMRCHAAVIASAHGQVAWIFRRRRRPPRTSRAAEWSTL
jgi:hypothetical protein